MLPILKEIQSAAEIVYKYMPATPQYCWPLLCKHLGTEVWVKHENHTPIGSFKIRGGLTYFAHLAESGRMPGGVITATRGNHGQSVGFAARIYNTPATVVVPRGNSVDKNAAMKALGTDLIERGEDYQSAYEHALELAESRSLQIIPSFDPFLVTGVATYSLELLKSVSEMDVVYVPIGLGSGICGMVAVRDALGLKTKVVGVVSSHAPAYADSFHENRLIERPATTRLADGMACRTPDRQAFEAIRQGVERIIKVTDNEIAAAMRLLFEATHNTSEGSGAAAMAAALQEKRRIAGSRVAVILSGGNIDRNLFSSVLAGDDGDNEFNEQPGC